MLDTDIMTRAFLIATRLTVSLGGGTDESLFAEGLDVRARHSFMTKQLGVDDLGHSWTIIYHRQRTHLQHTLVLQPYPHQLKPTLNPTHYISQSRQLFQMSCP
ncbi:hypothetical protein N9095_00045 [bacterium]|nr:hypothetical protein [bacterium]MDB4588347.1 hypothetical protein [bacterium]